jgi:hypothetical protein
VEVAAPGGVAWELGNGQPCPDDEAAAVEEGRWRVVLIGNDKESMRRSRGEASLAVDDSRLGRLRAKRRRD